MKQPIWYCYRTLKTEERAYETTHRECLAVIWAVLILRSYLKGSRFTIRTDHQALRWILNMSDATGKMEIWRLRLSELELDVVHRAGVKHQAAEALSRLPFSGDDETTIEDEIPLLWVENTQVMVL